MDLASSLTCSCRRLVLRGHRRGRVGASCNDDTVKDGLVVHSTNGYEMPAEPSMFVVSTRDVVLSSRCRAWDVAWVQWSLVASLLVTCFGLGSCLSCRLSRGKVLGPGLPAPSCEEGGRGQSCPGHDVCSPETQPAWFSHCQTTAHSPLVQPWQSCPQSHTRLWVTTVRPIRGGHPVHHSMRIEYQAI